VSSQNPTNSSHIFEKHKVSTLLVKFSLPAILSLLVSEMYNMVDSIFVGNAVGTLGMGALTVAFPVQRLFISLALMVAMGTSTYVARSYGEKDVEKVNHIISNSFLLLFVIIAGTALFIGLNLKKTIYFLGSSTTIFPYAKTYIGIVLWGVFFQAFTSLCSHIMVVLGRPRVLLTSMLIGSICNVIIDYVLVILIPLGVQGAAIATISSQFIAAVYTFIVFTKAAKKENIHISKKLDFFIAKSILAIGFSNFIVEVSDAVVAVILNQLLSTYGGDTAIAIVGIISRSTMVLFMTVIGVSTGMQPIAAYNFGAQNFIRLKKVLREATIGVTASTFVLWGGAMVFAQPIARAFVKDPIVIAEATKALRIVILIFPVLGVHYLNIYYYQAIGKVRSAFLLSIYRQIIIFIPLVFLLTFQFELWGAWIAYPISDLIAFVTSVVLMIKAYKEVSKEAHVQYLQEKEQKKLTPKTKTKNQSWVLRENEI